MGKTKSAAFDRAAFLASVEDMGRKAETERLLAIFGETTGWEPRLWGPSMVGFGRYDYRCDSGTAGESLAVGFSPRKAELSLYGLSAGDRAADLLTRLGPHRSGKACLYIKRLAAVDEAVLASLIRAGLDELSTRWPVHPA